MPARTQRPEIHASTWKASDGKEMPWRQWPEKKVPSHPRAIIIAVHGLSGAALDFWPIGEAVEADGDLLLCGLQLRGQGNDPDKGARGDIRHAKEWQHDLKDFNHVIHRRYPGVPVFWWGESLGSLICLHSCLEADVDQPAGLILAAPPVQLRQKLPSWKNALIKALITIVPSKKLTVAQLGGTQAARMQITSTSTHSQQMAVTPHFVPAFSLRLLGQVEGMIKQAPAAAKKLQLPLLVLYTEHDPLVSKEGVESWFKLVASPDKQSIFFPRSYHLVLHDVERDDAVRRSLDWIEHRADQAKKR